jgi:DNA repair exonuclease SbcCD ATPase subunit
MDAELWQTCIECGIRFGVPASFDAQRRRDKRSFYCPNSHPQAYLESEEDRLRAKLKAAEKERDRIKQNAAYLEDRYAEQGRNLEHEQHRRRAIQGQLTKTRKRIGGGVCPCCNRSFEDLRNHMASKHAGYAEETVQQEAAA